MEDKKIKLGSEVNSQQKGADQLFPSKLPNDASQISVLSSSIHKKVAPILPKSAGLSVSSVNPAFLPSNLPALKNVPIKEMIPGSKLVPMYLVIDSNVPNLPSASVVMNKAVSDTNLNQHKSNQVMVENQSSSQSFQSKEKVISELPPQSVMNKTVHQSKTDTPNAPCKPDGGSTTQRLNVLKTQISIDKVDPCPKSVRSANQIPQSPDINQGKSSSTKVSAVKRALPCVKKNVSGLTLSDMTDGVTPMSVISPMTHNQVSQNSSIQISPRTFNQIQMQNQTLIPGNGVSQSQTFHVQLSGTIHGKPRLVPGQLLRSPFPEGLILSKVPKPNAPNEPKVESTMEEVAAFSNTKPSIEPSIIKAHPCMKTTVQFPSVSVNNNKSEVRNIPTQQNQLRNPIILCKPASVELAAAETLKPTSESTSTNLCQTDIDISQSDISVRKIPPKSKISPGVQYISSSGMPQWVIPPNTTVVPPNGSSPQIGSYANILSGIAQTLSVHQNPVPLNRRISQIQSPIPPASTLANRIQIESGNNSLGAVLSKINDMDSIIASSGCQIGVPKNRKTAPQPHTISNFATEDAQSQESLEDDGTLEEEKVTFPYAILKKQRKLKSGKKKATSTKSKKAPKAKAVKQGDSSPATDIDDKDNGSQNDPTGDAEATGEFVITENQQESEEEYEEDDWNSSDDEYVKLQKKKEEMEDLFNPDDTDCSDKEDLASSSSEKEDKDEDEDEDDKYNLFKGPYIEFISFTKALKLMYESTNDSEFLCKNCGDSFNCKFEAKKHLLTHRPFKCLACDLTFATEYDQRVHLKTHTDRFCCTRCTYSTTEAKTLENHVVEKHNMSKESFRRQNSEMTWICHICGNISFTLSMFREHMSESHNSTPLLNEGMLQCPFCKKLYSTRGSLKSHLLHHRGRIFKCSHEGCSFESVSQCNLQEHKKTKHEGVRYPCPHEGCSQLFTEKSRVRKHIAAVHIKDRKCICVNCGKKFVSKKHLNVHMLIHSDKKPLGCQYCDYRCRQRAAMNWHMNKTHPDKEYVVKTPTGNIGGNKPGRKPSGKKRKGQGSESNDGQDARTTRKSRQLKRKKERISSDSSEEETDSEDQQKSKPSGSNSAGKVAKSKGRKRKKVTETDKAELTDSTMTTTEPAQSRITRQRRKENCVN